MHRMSDSEISDLIDSYRPNEEGVQMLLNTTVVLVVGITGAGKNTILDKLLQTGGFYDMITSVTRQPRVNNGVMEKDGIDYYFLSEEQAINKIKAGDYVEVSPVHKRIYGVTVDEVRKAHDTDKTAIADVTVLGVEKYKKISDDVIAIFVLPPSFEEWQRRMRLRFDSEEAFMEDWPNRRESAIMELRKALSEPYYHFVINENVDDAVEACQKIINSGNVFHRKDEQMRELAQNLLDSIISNA